MNSSIIPSLRTISEEVIFESTRIAKRWVPIKFKRSIASTLEEGGPAYTLISGLPVDRILPPPPYNGLRPIKKETWVSEMALLGLLNASGLEPMAYLQEREGNLIQEISPVKGKEKTFSTANSEELGWHSDNAMIPREYQAEGIALYSLVNEGTPTRIAIAQELISYLSKEDFKQLQKPQFQFPLPESFKSSGNRPYSSLRPILTTNAKGFFEIAVAMYNVRANSLIGARAVNALALVTAHLCASKPKFLKTVC